MQQSLQQLTEIDEIIYPESDGLPMAENTKQFTWIVVIKENLEALFAEDPNIFIAGDLFWYPTKGNNKRRQAPDIMVAIGRPKGDRSSYKQWQEDNIPPQVVFEILSPGNRHLEMSNKLMFYQRFGVEEYYIYDPETLDLTGYLRAGDWLEPIEDINHWVSPRLGIRFELTSENLEIYSPDGKRFLTFVELHEKNETSEQRALASEQRALASEQRALAAEDKLAQAEAEIEALKARLKEL